MFLLYISPNSIKIYYGILFFNDYYYLNYIFLTTLQFYLQPKFNAHATLVCILTRGAGLTSKAGSVNGLRSGEPGVDPGAPQADSGCSPGSWIVRADPAQVPHNPSTAGPGTVTSPHHVHGAVLRVPKLLWEIRQSVSANGRTRVIFQNKNEKMKITHNQTQAEAEEVFPDSESQFPVL